MLMFVFFFSSIFFYCFSWLNMLLLMVVVSLMFFLFSPINMDYFALGMHVDIISFNLMLMTFFLFIFMILSSQFVYKFNFSSYILYNFYFCFLVFFLYFSFLLKNMLLFYFMFESSLIPTFMLILGWGVQPERLQASIYFFFYTLFMSVPLLFIILLMFSLSGSLMFHVFYFMVSSSDLYTYFFMIFFLFSFLVKMPIYFFHLWLPKAHVEAPVSGSMILAAVLLKLGSYGLCRVFFLLSMGIMKISSYVFSLSLLSMVFVGLICCRMSDMKALIAYSSVAHMGMLICSLFGYLGIGILGSLMIMISHGITSSGLFCLVNMIYERTMSRSIYVNKGLSAVFPLFSFMMFMLCACNFSTPPFMSLLSEIFLLIALMSYTFLMGFIFFFGSLLGTVFCMYLFSFTSHGKKFNINMTLTLLSMNEFHVIFLHLFVVLFMPYMMYYLY